MVISQNGVSYIHSELEFSAYVGIVDIRSLEISALDERAHLKQSVIFILFICSSTEDCNLIDARRYVHHYHPLITPIFIFVHQQKTILQC